MITRRKAQTLGTLAKLAFCAQFICVALAAPLALVACIPAVAIAGLQLFRNYADRAWNEAARRP